MLYGPFYESTGKFECLKAFLKLLRATLCYIPTPWNRIRPSGGSSDEAFVGGGEGHGAVDSGGSSDGGVGDGGIGGSGEEAFVDTFVVFDRPEPCAQQHAKPRDPSSVA